LRLGSRLSRALLYDLEAVGRQVQEDGLGYARTLLRRNPIVIHVRVAIALRVFDERCMDGVRDQFFYSIGHMLPPAFSLDKTEITKAVKQCIGADGRLAGDSDLRSVLTRRVDILRSWERHMEAEQEPLDALRTMMLENRALQISSFR